MVMCIQRKIFVMDWKIPPSSLKQNAIPAPRGFAPRVWNLHFAFVIRVEFFNPSLKFSLDLTSFFFHSFFDNKVEGYFYFFKRCTSHFGPWPKLPEHFSRYFYYVVKKHCFNCQLDWKGTFSTIIVDFKAKMSSECLNFVPKTVLVRFTSFFFSFFLHYFFLFFMRA